MIVWGKTTSLYVAALLLPSSKVCGEEQHRLLITCSAVEHLARAYPSESGNMIYEGQRRDLVRQLVRRTETSHPASDSHPSADRCDLAVAKGAVRVAVPSHSPTGEAS